MSEEAGTTATPSQSINAQVAERIKNCAPEVETRLVDLLAEREVSRRVELISQGLAKLNELTKEGYKLNKPTNVTYNLDGSVAASSFSKEALEAIKKHTEKTEKLQRAVDKALRGDISDLPGLLK